MANELYKIYSSLDPIAHSGDTIEIAVAQSLKKAGVDYLTASGPKLTVAVQGPQTSLSEGDLAGVYPAAGSNDSPDNFLPHIALTRRTLPWERIGPGPKPPAPNQPTEPWLALLLLTRADLARPDTVRVGPALPTGVYNVQLATAQTEKSVASAQVTSAKVPQFQTMITPELATKRVAVKDIATSDASTHTALTGTAGISDADMVDVIEIPNATLKKILPAAADLSLLCNAKEVNQDGVTTFTSIVVSGRLPDAGDNDPNHPPALHMAVLVSLEQRGDVYARLNDSGFNTLIALHSWTFTPSKGADFREVCQLIGYRPNGGVLRFGNLPKPAEAPAQAPLSGGYAALLKPTGFFQTPLEHSEAGNVIWRGPLRPFPPAPRSNGVAIRSAPEELDNQPADAPLDYSNATAFELGKLLALADPGIREDLRDIHEFLKLPEHLVATSDIPEVFQKPYWGMDLGDPYSPAENKVDQVLQNPWSFAGNQSMLGIQNVIGTGDVSGIAAQATVWQNVAIAQLNQAAQNGSQIQISQIDLTQINEATLELQFPEVKNAGILSHQG